MVKPDQSGGHLRAEPGWASTLPGTQGLSRPLPSGPAEEHDKVVFLRKYCAQKPPRNRVPRSDRPFGTPRGDTKDKHAATAALRKAARAGAASAAALALPARTCALTRQRPGRSRSGKLRMCFYLTKLRE